VLGSPQSGFRPEFQTLSPQTSDHFASVNVHGQMSPAVYFLPREETRLLGGCSLFFSCLITWIKSITGLWLMHTTPLSTIHSSAQKFWPAKLHEWTFIFNGWRNLNRLLSFNITLFFDHVKACVHVWVVFVRCRMNLQRVFVFIISCLVFAHFYLWVCSLHSILSEFHWHFKLFWRTNGNELWVSLSKLLVWSICLIKDRLNVRRVSFPVITLS